MRKQFLLTLLFASVTALLSAQSPPPPPTPTPTAQTKQNASGIENRPAQDAISPAPSPAATVNQLTATPTQSSANKKGAVKRDGSSIDWALILSIANTALLLCFNGILAFVAIYQYQLTSKQADLTEKGLAEARRAADAANTSADAANKAIVHSEKTTLLTQRAAVLLEDVVATPHGGQDGHSYYFLHNSLLVFTLKNYGPTVAYNVMMEGKIRFGEKFMPVFGDPGMTMAPQGSNKWITASLITRLSAEEIETAATGNNLLTYVLDVNYDDVFGKHHNYKVTGSYIAPLQGFITGMSTTSD